ncbi:hypothetical protein FIU97_09470 [Roseivivax sp. THAF40]|nr:hypothetical protein FIU97_09470 [Roseivivax sp. THAF40]
MSMLRNFIFCSVLLTTLAACDDTSEEAYDQGYEDGYNAGLDELCLEVGRIAPNVLNSLRQCGGF